MIQRKQSLFLLDVVIIAIIQFFLPFQTLTTADKSFPIYLIPQDVTGSNIYFVLISNTIILILSITIIFLYKNRVLQYKLTNLLALFNLILISLFFTLSHINEGQQGTVSYQFGSFLPVVSIIFSLLAAHFIKKDEQLVRSADRIR